jgi:hypothetical protein
MEAALLETLDPLDAKATVRALVHLARQHHGGAPSQ